MKENLGTEYGGNPDSYYAFGYYLAQVWDGKRDSHGFDLGMISARKVGEEAISAYEMGFADGAGDFGLDAQANP